MAGRRCASCGISLPRTTSRCPSCGHVESDAIVVEIDGPPESGPAGSGHRRGRDLLVIASVLIALAVGLVVVSDDRGEDDDAAAAARSTTTTTERQRPRRTTRTTRPMSTTTTTLETFGPRPILGGESTGIVLMLTNSSGSTRLVDLDAASEIQLPGEVELNTNFVTLPVKGGFIGTRAGLPVLVFLDGRIVPITGADFRVTNDGQRIFSVGHSEMLSFAEELDLDGNRVGEYDLGANGLFFVTGHGVVTQNGGRVFLVDREGEVRGLGVGHPLAAGRDLVAIWTCDERMRCGPVIAEPDGTTRGFPDPPPGEAWSECCAFMFSPDDRYLAMQTAFPGPEPEHPPRLVLIDTRSMSVAHVIDVLYAGSLAWSQDSRWLFVSTQGPCFAFEVDLGQLVELPFSCRDGVVATSR